MQPWLTQLALYVLVTFIFRLLCARLRIHDFIFAVLNAVTCYLCFFYGEEPQFLFGIYIAVLFIQYLLMVVGFRTSGSFISWLAILFPGLLLVGIKIELSDVPIGISYMSFRLIYLGYEIYSHKIKKVPSIINFYSYVFFPLTFLFGPISAYERFGASIKHGYVRVAPYSRCLGRILVGMIKCYLIAHIFDGLSFQTYWKLDLYHNFAEFTVSAIATASYIYFNFSGICDIMIGAAGIIGMQVDENFNNPFLARNLADFWGRWHMTLSRLVLEVFYTPLLISVGRYLDNRILFMLYNALLALLLFTLIGVWHGNEIGFVLFGIMHGTGIIIVHLYGRLIPYCPAFIQRLAYHSDSRFFATIITMLYVSYSSVFFETSSEDELMHIFNHLVLP